MDCFSGRDSVLPIAGLWQEHTSSNGMWMQSGDRSGRYSREETASCFHVGCGRISHFFIYEILNMLKSEDGDE
jgi:hypothetical protein